MVGTPRWHREVRDSMKKDIYYVRIKDKEFKVAFEKDGVFVDGALLPAELVPTAHKAFVKARIHNQILAFPIDQHNEEVRLLLSGREYVAQVEDERQRTLRSLGSIGEETGAGVTIKAPMPGLVVKIEVNIGDSIERGQGIAVVEAMKMENEVRAQGGGIVKDIRVKDGQTVEKGEVLVVIE